jgi:hypothetical protein
VDNQGKVIIFPAKTRQCSFFQMTRRTLEPTRHIQGVSRLVDITAGGDFLGPCDQKTSYKHVSDFGRLRSYDHLKLGIEVSDY